MFSGIRIYTSDPVWRKILTDLNATVSDAPEIGAIDFDALGVKMPISPLDLRVILLNALDNSRIINEILGRDVTLPPLQQQIIVLLNKTGGMSAEQLKVALGYSPDATTHVVDTAVYQLRKLYGRDFIQNQNGVYLLGRV